VEYREILKAAILGTDNYHATMRQTADSSLRRALSYTPPRLNVDSLHNSFPLVHAACSQETDKMMQQLGSDSRFTNCNKCSPYLILAWLLIGSDNEYRTCQYLDDLRLPKQIAIIHVRLALGNVNVKGEKEVVTQVARASRIALDNWRPKDRHITRVALLATWAAARTAQAIVATIRSVNIPGAAGGAAKAAEDAASMSGVVEGVARTAISTKAREWAHISDEEALRIARQLTLDILSL
jgi:hypothetical protein